MRFRREGWTGLALLAGLGVAWATEPEPQWLPTGALITPWAAPGASLQALNPGLADLPGYRADHAVTAVPTPDGKTLLVLTSGFNRNYAADGKIDAADSNEYVFVFDVSGDVATQIQVLKVPNAYSGLAVAPDGAHFFVAGGCDDNVHVFERSAAGWREARAPIALGHPFGEGLVRSTLATKPAAAGLAVTADGSRVVVANFANDTVSIVDWAAGRVAAEVDLRPGKIDPTRVGQPGGTYPYGVAIRGSDTAFVSSVRDREVLAIALAPAPRVAARIHLRGNPNRLVLDQAGRRLYVAEDNADRIGVIDTARLRLLDEWPLRLAAAAGHGHLPGRGIAPDNLSLSHDERRLYVAAAGINAIALLDLPGGRLRGWIPTGWYPTAVSAAADDRRLFILNAKSVEGPNAGNCVQLHTPPAAATECPADRPMLAANDYVLQHSKAALATVPLPDAAMLAALSRRVGENNRTRAELSPEDRRIFRAMRRRIRHVIYIVKENRTYDQLLGDLNVGNGDPGLAQFPAAVTPNQHRLAGSFVDLDAFYDSGEVSGTGWPWSVAARTADVTEKSIPVHYAARGLSYDSEGTNRDVNVALPTAAARVAANPATQADPDVLAGAVDVAAPDGADDEGDEREQGFLWDTALRHHLSVRNYGFFTDLARYSEKMPETHRLPLLRDPAATHTAVAFATNPALAPHTDPYFRGFDNQFPDFYRFREWEREFSDYEQRDRLPRLEFVRFMHDHLGNFATAVDGVNTPDRQVADNDYAVGLLVERIAHSRYARDTLIVVVEDDAQDGPDHVDAHRSIAFVAGPYVKRGAVVSTRYTTVSLLRTMELVMGLPPLNVHDAQALPMSDVFDLHQADWSFDATVPEPLRATGLPLPPRAAQERPGGADLCSGAEPGPGYWAARTAGMDFDSEDRLDAQAFNHLLWEGRRRDAYPTQRSGADLRVGRDAVLAAWAARCQERN